MNFFECYSTLSRLNESKTEYQSFLNSFSTPQELLDWMKKNITYHLEIEDYDIEVPDERPTQNGEEIFSSKNGHCAEQSYLEKDVLESLGYEPKLVCVKENNSGQDYDYYGCTHVFVVYPENDKYVWFENAMHRETGIHEYNSLEELFTDFAKKWRKGEKGSDTLEFRYIDEISGIGNAELAKKCHQYPIIFSADISNNKLEESLTESINYKRITDKAAFNTFRTHAHDAFGDSIIDDYSLEEDAGYMNEIYKDGQLIGYVGFSEYTGEADDDFDKALGIGNFIIIDRGKGLGSEVIRDIVDRYKETFDLIYCFVDANNAGAIKLYKRLGTVHDEYGPNEKGEYYVVFYDKNKTINEAHSNKKDDLDNLRKAIQGAEEAAEIKVSDDSTMACGMEHHTIVNWLKELLARKTGSPFKKRYEVMTIPQAIEHIEKDIFPEADEETYAIHKELLDWLIELKELREKDTI